jgi:hypothetical protein
MRTQKLIALSAPAIVVPAAASILEIGAARRGFHPGDDGHVDEATSLGEAFNGMYTRLTVR